MYNHKRWILKETAMNYYYAPRMLLCFMCAWIWAFGIQLLFDTMLPEIVTEEKQSVDHRGYTNYEWKNDEIRNNKWMVVEVDTVERCNLTLFLKNTEWSIVSVGGEQSPYACRLPRCVHLDRYALMGVHRHVNARITSQKSIAYLYAIQMGATIIYDTTCNFKPLNNLGQFMHDKTSSGLILDAERGSSAFNPFRHFGHRDVFPVGMPRNASILADYHYTVSKFRRPSIQHCMVEGQQGVSDSGECGYLTFDAATAPVIIPPGIFAFHHRVPTLFFKDAFWAILSPLASSVKNSLVTSLIMQRLLWEIGGFTSFVGSSIMADSSVSQCNPSLSDSQQTANEKLIVQLHDWQCNESLTFSQCILDLYYRLLELDLITNNDVNNMDAWLQELQWLGYEAPARNTTHFQFKRTAHVFYSSTDTCPYSAEISNSSLTNDTSQYLIGYKEVLKYCMPFNLSCKPAQIPDIMLIITFNKPSFYNNILILDFIYRQYFQYILVCGNKKEQFEELLQRHPYFTSFIYVEGLTENWFFMYECTALAMQMNFNVSGYLQIGDDTLINPWQIRTLQRDKIWFPKGLGLLDRQSMERRGTRWGDHMGKRAIDGVFHYLHNSVNAHARNFLQLYSLNVRGEQFVYTRGCDFFYIPQRLKADYVYLEDVFHRHASMVEIALPVMVLGLDHVTNIQWVRDTSLWFRGERELYDRFYDEFIYFLHPFKLAQYLKQERGKNMFCNKYLNFLKLL